jgi:hypothetical protein
MSQIILNIHPLQGNTGTICSIDRAPFEVEDRYAQQQIDLADIAGLAGIDVVRAIGEGLATKIRGNQTISQVLDRAFTQPPAPPSLPICFRVGDQNAHALSWESLFGNGDFIALDDRWPIARIARGGQVPEGAERPFAPPLRLLCVISAVQTSGREEWDQIFPSVESARGNGLPIEVTLIAGEQDLLDSVTAKKLPDVEVLSVPETGTDLIELIRQKDPHLVHFYCHGNVVERSRLLEIGTTIDHDNNANTSSVIVRIEELWSTPVSPWLVSLNMCRGADAQIEGLTHAEELVNRGVPVAVGMRRVVDAADAHVFAAAFYPSVFRAIQAATGGGSPTIEWADTLVQARRRLRDQHGSVPESSDEWTVPVMYTRPGDFRVVVTAPGTANEATRDLGESQTIGGLLDVLGDQVPRDVVGALTGGQG